MAYVHMVMVIHRDIKPANILLTGQSLTLRLADLGSAAWSQPHMWHSDVVGSITNLAPEALPTRAGHSESAHVFQGRPVDVWAAAVSLYELAAGVPPFRAPTMMQMFHSIRQGREREDLFKPLGLNSFPALWAMLAPDPAQRCSAEHACFVNRRAELGSHRASANGATEPS